MRNMLIDELPDTIEVSGSSVKIRTDFRVGLQMDALVRDNDLSNEEKVKVMLNLYLVEKVNNYSEAIDQILEFFACGKRKQRDENDDSNQSKRNTFSFEHDAGYIIAAFMAQYGIDLTECDIHWHKFVALFRALTDQNEIIKIIGYRSANLSAIKDKSEKRRIAKLQAIYALPDEYAGISSEELAGQMFGGGLF